MKVLLVNNFRIIAVLTIYLFAINLWANNNIANIYQKYDQIGAKKDSNLLLGLAIREHVHNQNWLAAEKLLEQSLLKQTANHDIIHWWLAKIAIFKGHHNDIKKHLLLVKNLPILKNTNLAKEFYDLLPNNHREWYVKHLVQAGFFDPVTESVCPYFELDKRQKRGQFIYQLVNNHSLSDELAKKALFELYVLLPEVIEVETLKKITGFSQFINTLKSNDLIKRMETLLVFGKNQQARDTFAESKPLHQQNCDLIYVDAKVDRKMRKYELAKSRFCALKKHGCSSETIIKARYMELMLKSQTKDIESIKDFAAFVSDYPTHSFADDVLMFQATLLLEKNRIDEALVVLAQLIKQYPEGDMVDRARFLLAFLWAQGGKTKQSIAMLEELMQKTSDELVWAQAQYWLARLLIFADLNSIKKPNTLHLGRAKKMLYQLRAAPFPNVYSYLASSLLLHLKEKLPAISYKTERDQPLKPLLQQDALYPILSLVTHGFRDEALALFEDVPVDRNHVDVAAHLAINYSILNRPQAAHQKLVRCDAILAQALRKKIPATFKQISYPKPFLNQVKLALKKVDVPEDLVFAIMRQESGFIPQSRSWAQAKGLMQLIYSSALSQSQKWHIKNLKENDLYQPEINLLLATSLLQAYWQRFGHVALGLAAYNAGPTMAKTWMLKNNGAPLDTFIENISFKETRDYVKSVLGGTFAYSIIEEHPSHSLPINQIILGER